jgi:hypothetical protein
VPSQTIALDQDEEFEEPDGFDKVLDQNLIFRQPLKQKRIEKEPTLFDFKGRGINSSSIFNNDDDYEVELNTYRERLKLLQAKLKSK